MTPTDRAVIGRLMIEARALLDSAPTAAALTAMRERLIAHRGLGSDADAETPDARDMLCELGDARGRIAKRAKRLAQTRTQTRRLLPIGGNDAA